METQQENFSGNSSAPAQSCGEIISWNLGGIKQKYKDVAAALKEAGLDESLVKELAPRHAFSRACRKLEKNRVITVVGETESEMTFQFTQEVVQSGEASYVKEDVLRLDKKVGTVKASNSSELEAHAQTLVDEAIEIRNGTDLGGLVQKLFEQAADLFPIRDQGGAYYVPEKHRPFITSVATFVSLMGGSLRRFPILNGTDAGTKSVKEAITDGLTRILEEHDRSIEAFDSDTRQGTMERRAAKIRETKLKVEAYAEYLQDQSSGLLDQLGKLQEKLVQKVESLAEVPEEEPSSSGKPGAVQPAQTGVEEGGLEAHLAKLRADLDAELQALEGQANEVAASAAVETVDPDSGTITYSTEDVLAH